ncbi:MAG: serine/threonine protein kinase, partial [Acidobacteria bacterium]
WKQFEREARLMARLNHPGLPRVTDYFTEGNRAFFVMQLVEGTDLAEIIARQPGPLPHKSVVAWADQLLDALIYLHSRERQIVHRDIKPHNLKVTPNGQIILLDFGLAKTESNDSGIEASSKSVFGYTPRYAPLEQIQDLGTTPRSDIYALGATLYHLLTGVKPPDALARAVSLVSAKPNPLKPANELNSAVNAELAAILNRAMAQNPDERYASAADFREALRCVGRVEESESVEFIAHQSPIQATIAEVSDTDTTVVASARVRAVGRLGSQAIAALFVILLTAFGTFCRYYPWKSPDMVAPQTNVTANESAIPQAQLPESVANQRAANQKRAMTNGAVKDTSMSKQHPRKSVLRS